MKRRYFIAGVAAALVPAWPHIAFGQQSSRKIWRVAFLHPETLSAAFETFRTEMRVLGYTESTNLIIDTRYAEGKFDRLPSLINDLLALRPDVIVAVATPAVAVAQRATSTIPIVMAPATDPVEAGFIKSLAHPGGNITGMANMFGDTTAKSVEVLHTLLPSAKLIAVLMSNNPVHPREYERVAAAAKQLGLAVIPVKAPTPAHLEQAFERMAQAHCDAMFVLGDPTRPAIVTLAAKSKMPTIYQFSNYVELGGLVSYGPDVKPLFAKVAHYVDKIFKGASPADLPVEQPIVFELALNLKAAASLGLAIPDSLITRADRVVD
jgi:putative tryptophan/tyrosine transport system substrate-binding protein